MRRIITGLLLSAFLGGASALADNTTDYGVSPSPNDTFTAGPNTAIPNDNQSPTQQPGTLGTDSTSGMSSAPGTDSSMPPSPSIGNYGNQPVQQPGTADTTSPANNPGYNDTMSSTAGAKEVTKGYLRNEVVALRPEVGAIGFKDGAGNTTSRILGGIGVDMNLASAINKDWGSLYAGPSTGAFFSHIGSPTSNFAGTSPDTGSGASDGANLLIIPANLKLGYAIGDSFRVSAHGGGNVLYRSIASAISLGSSSGTGDSNWRIFPNAGADFEVGFGKNVSLLLRPDVTFTPDQNMYTGTIGLGISMG